VIVVTGTLPLKPAEVESALDAVRTLRQHTLRERGCHAYRFAIDIDEAHLLHLHEEWEDDDALQEHMATPQFADFLERIGDKLAGAPHVTRWDGATSRPLFG
jgi:quinol monooxygenase YgiN